MSENRPAKPVDNLALRVFQRYYHELCQALSCCPEEVAAVLYSNELVSMQERSQAVDALGLTPFRKAEILVQAVERRIVAENNAAPLRKFCRVLHRRHGVGSIISRIKFRLAYVEQHHQLPDDEWSSDTESEQGTSAYAQEDQLPLSDIPPVIQRHSQYLKELYRRRSRMNLKWPPVLMKDFVDLLCIESHNHQDERMTKEMVRGHISEVENTRKTVQLSDLAPTKNGEVSNCILVQGAPGSGKTMFSWEVCRRWGQGELLHQYPLVVMLPLRDPDVQNANSLEDLFPHDKEEYAQEVAVAVKQEAGKGVLFLLDGFDELPAVKRQEPSLWMRLITGRLLPLATVMVTSRPWAIKPLLTSKHISRITQHVEIVGFTSDNINEYINKAFPNAAEKSKFCDYLSTCPHIRSTMYIPLNCAVVVEVYRSSRSKHSMPKTMTQLYAALVRELLLRYIESHPNSPTLGMFERVTSIFKQQRRIGLFEDIPFNVYQQLCIISSIAYSGLANNQQLIFSNLPANFETLGLLQRVSQVHSVREKATSYNFLHLTVQEFLAAFYIALQRSSKHQKLLRLLTMEKGEKKSSDNVVVPFSNGSSGRIAMDTKRMQGSDYFVRLFVAGLTKCRDYPVPVPVWISMEEIIALHLLFESQNKSLTTSELGDKDSVREVLMDSLSPHDAYVLGYCISQSSCQWMLSLPYIGDEHAEMLKRAINSWGPGEGTIIQIYSKFSRLSSDGMSHLLSLPHHILSGLSKLVLGHENPTQPCEMQAHHLSPLIPHLKELRLRGYEIGCEGAQLLSQFLQTNTTLIKLELSYAGIKDKEVCSLAQVLSVNRSLKKMNLSGNQIGCEGTQLLSQILCTNSTLQELDLSRCSIGHREFCSLAKALSTNSSLKVLNFTLNKIGCEGAELLSQSLHENSELTVLHLSGNDIKDRGGCALAKALSVNVGLEHLALGDNPLGEETTRQLIGSLQHNHTLKSIYLPRLWKEFAHNCNGFDKTRCFFYH